jgi:hypothetical protein
MEYYAKTQLVMPNKPNEREWAIRHIGNQSVIRHLAYNLVIKDNKAGDIFDGIFYTSGRFTTISDNPLLDTLIGQDIVIPLTIDDLSGNIIYSYRDGLITLRNSMSKIVERISKVQGAVIQFNGDNGFNIIIDYDTFKETLASGKVLYDDIASQASDIIDSGMKPHAFNPWFLLPVIDSIGSRGLKCSNIPIDKFKSFDPLVESIVWDDTPTKINLHKGVSEFIVPVRGKTYVLNEGVMEVPLSVAIFSIASRIADTV